MGLVTRFEGKAVNKNFRSILAEYEDVYEAEVDDNMMWYSVPIYQYQVSFYLFDYWQAKEWYFDGSDTEESLEEEVPWDKDDFIISHIQWCWNRNPKEIVDKQKAKKWVRKFFEKIIKND